MFAEVSKVDDVLQLVQKDALLLLVNKVTRTVTSLCASQGLRISLLFSFVQLPSLQKIPIT